MFQAKSLCLEVLRKRMAMPATSEVPVYRIMGVGCSMPANSDDMETKVFDTMQQMPKADAVKRVGNTLGVSAKTVLKQTFVP